MEGNCWIRLWTILLYFKVDVYFILYYVKFLELDPNVVIPPLFSDDSEDSNYYDSSMNDCYEDSYDDDRIMVNKWLQWYALFLHVTSRFANTLSLKRCHNRTLQTLKLIPLSITNLEDVLKKLF